MRWKYPKCGDRRTRTFFALLPWYWRGVAYWLEWITVTEVYLVYWGYYLGWQVETLRPANDGEEKKG